MSGNTVVISIAQQFSPTPGGRYLDDGPFPGEKFRVQLLHPALAQGGTVQVLLDGTAGYGSSFLEEAFGGLVRNGWTAEELHRRLEITSSRPSYVTRIWSYIDRGAEVLR